MSQINPLFGTVVQGTHVQQKQAVEKDRALRRVQNLARDTALQGDRLEHQVESSEALSEIHDQPDNQRPPRKSKPRQAKDEANPEEPEQRLDLTA